MRSFADILFQSMIKQNPDLLPFADTYAATENGKPGALVMMSCWSSVTGLNYIAQFFSDPETGQLFVTANLDESGKQAIFFGRLRIDGGFISELELYIVRSRVDAGFVFLPEEMKKIPRQWSSDIPEAQKASREELLAVGKAVFDGSSGEQFEASEQSVLMEMGGIVYEDPDYLEAIMDEKAASAGPVTIPASFISGRPSDPKARVLIADAAQGVVISFGVVPGFVSAYIVPGSTASCFVPACMIDMHRKTVEAADKTGRKILKEMPATGLTAEIVCFHSGKIQGIHRYVSVQAPGVESSWV